ncbi:GGDEF domain-containing protein [Mesorhizobium sp. BR1-1-16]|uniref:GGDEF domain-containing protein n=1 Tax=Mesorhizobium sp. BR1-1-16 TaxID=2876653 RepID=UPI001CCDBC76|nr:GGDEF domain-containing protein [Mesorhizobium sp. BR1-1-16]MBZ9936619.1 GGDEF domain-containing protein [Mesorhizobium sp. BR1-1-16]
MKFDFTRTGWSRVIIVTIVGTFICIAAALFVDSFNFSGFDETQLARAIAVDILLPIGLAVPMLFLLMSKLRELAIANNKLANIAATDSLTSVLTRSAFTVLVDAYLDKFSSDADRMRGAFLVVDADDFKRINDLYGHSSGDSALRLIASTIRQTLRPEDLVGRVGGDEFTVFLPGSSPSQAAAMAEQMRQTIYSADAHFLHDHRRLSISIGGTTFAGSTSFNALFNAADERLYEAKARGRNRIEIEPL